MNRPPAKSSATSLDFVVYAGDPDVGSEAIDSARVIREFDRLRDHLKFDEAVYGSVTITKNGKELVDKRPDLILGLVTKFVRALPYIIDGEPETALLAESDHGFLFERSNDDVLLSFFAGNDAFAPDEYLLEQSPIPVDAFATQVIGMGDRMIELLKKWDAKLALTDDYGKSLAEMLEAGKAAYKSFRVEREKGVSRR